MMKRGYQADFSFNSLKDLDRFFDEVCETSAWDSVYNGDLDIALFMFACYWGETAKNICGGKWDVDERFSHWEDQLGFITQSGNSSAFIGREIVNRYNKKNFKNFYSYFSFVTGIMFSTSEKQRLPYLINVYKGEKRYAFEPLIYNIYNFPVSSEKFIVLPDSANELMLGKTVLDLFAYLCGENYVEYTNKNQPDYTRFSKHRKWTEFTKMNLCAELEMTTQKIVVSAMERHSVRGMGCGYVGGNFKKELSLNTPAEKLGNTLLSAFGSQK